jgi:hypothetical protein
MSLGADRQRFIALSGVLQEGRSHLFHVTYAANTPCIFRRPVFMRPRENRKQDQGEDGYNSYAY